LGGQQQRTFSEFQRSVLGERDEALARLTLARKIAAITLLIWKEGG
jgi:hypothetical protein